MDSFRLMDVFNILSRIVFGSVIVLPLSVSNYNLSHQEGISLKYSKTAPPLAIFDDEKIQALAEDFEVTPAKKESLQTNRLQTRKMVTKIARRFEALQKESLKAAPPPRVIRTLAGMSLAKNSPSIVAIKNTISEPIKTVSLPKAPARTLAPQKIQREVIQEPVVSNQPNAIETQKFIAGLNSRMRDRVSEIENFDEVLNEDYGTESFEARAQAVIAKEAPEVNTAEYQADLKKDITRNVTTVAAGPARKSFAQRMEAAKNNADRISRNYARSGYTKGLGAPKQPQAVAPKETQDDLFPGEKSSEKGTVVAARSNLRQAIVSGTLEMTKGLAYTGSQEIVVYRQIGGTRYGYGQVMIQQGRYEILVEEPNTGVVIAELIENGNMVGRAEILMPEVMNNLKSQEDLKNIPIRLEPIMDQVVAENISAYSYYKKEKTKNSQMKIADTVNGSAKVFNSTVMIKTMKDNHWGNIILGSSKQVFTNFLNPEATIKALKEILGVRTPDHQMGIIKGEVSIAGNTVAGAQVEVVGMGQDSIKPVYFNSFFPDTSLTETTQNGQYAFVDLPEGSYIVRAKYKGKYLSPQLAPVEPGFVTQVQFDVQKPSLSEAFVFDIQSSEMMNAEISFLGSEQRVPVQSRKLISFSGSSGMQFLEVEAQDQNYYATRVTVDKSEKEILIPMISQNWLNNLLSRLKINSLPDTGLIIGTAHELPYAVELDPNAYNEDTKIVYFDNQGRLVPGAMITPQGGGFVAINVNQGIRSLFNKYHGTKNLKITTMAVDNSAINVFNSKF